MTNDKTSNRKNLLFGTLIAASTSSCGVSVNVATAQLLMLK